MKRLILAAVAVAIVLSGIFALLPAQSRPAPADAATTGKYDGDCTGHEVEGRCADKCPAATDKGAYNLLGYDKETGAAICKFTYFNACPYFEGAEAGTPECEKGKPTKEQLEPWKPEEPAKPTVNQCGGK